MKFLLAIEEIRLWSRENYIVLYNGLIIDVRCEMDKINIYEKLNLFNEYWSLKALEEVNE
jgi:hypothetical protein